MHTRAHRLLSMCFFDYYEGKLVFYVELQRMSKYI